MKKIISAVLVLLMIVPLMAFTAFADGVTADTSWYSADMSEFVISTAAQLLGIANINSDFAGKTIKLDADITFNTGSASSWAESAPQNTWKPIANFAGTFDGQGHTVSGLYYVVKSGNKASMFVDVADAALIKNFKLVNSYFATLTGHSVAGIASTGAGTFEKIYTDAILDCKTYHAGGIFGIASGPVYVRECWFAGSINIGYRYAAGIIGNGNGYDVVIEHCLNTGSVYSEYSESNQSHIGGMCGRNDAITTIVDCLNTGLISSKYTEISGDDPKEQFGSLFGSCSKNVTVIGPDGGDVWESKVDISNSWASVDSCIRMIGRCDSKDPDQLRDCNTLTMSQFFGYNGYTNTTLDFNNYWAVNLEGAPILKCFAEVVPPLYKLNLPVISQMSISTDTNFGPKWTVTLTVPEEFKKSDIQVGVLIAPTKTIPDGISLTTDIKYFEYRGNNYPVANVLATSYHPSDSNTVIASFVITDLDVKTIRSNYTVRPYALYSISGTSLEMGGDPVTTSFYTEAKLLEPGALKTKVDSLLAPVDSAIGTGFTVSRDWSTMDLFEDIPALVKENTSIKPATDYGDGNYVIAVHGTEGDYADYVALLEHCGFTKVVDNGEEGIADAIFTTNFTKGDLMVCVTDVSYRNITYISAIWDQPLSPHLFDNYKNTVIAGNKNVLVQPELYYWGDSYIIQLKNGHFIVIDGATEYELEYLLDYLESRVPTGTKPVIEAWCCTHLHYDHFYILKSFLDNPSWVDRVYVEGFYISKPSDAVFGLQSDFSKEIEAEYRAISTLKTTSGKTPPIYRPQTGQRYYFCDITMEILFAQEQLPVEEYQGGFNDSSTWYRFTMDGQTFIEAGDSHLGGMGFIMDCYEPEDIQCDFWSVLHHGGNTSQHFCWIINKFNVILFPTDLTRLVSDVAARIRPEAIPQNATEPNLYLIDHGKEVYCAGYGGVEFYLPYVNGRLGTDGGRVDLPLRTSHYFY